MATNSMTVAESLLVAVDVAKRYHDVLVKWPSGKNRYFKVANAKSDHLKLSQFLREQGHQVIVALEATADYHRPIAYHLAESGFSIHLAPSLACARVREALYNSWDKHDRKDARVILYLLEQGMTQPFHDPLLAGYLDVQELANTYHQIALARSRCLHSLLNHYLALFFPEMEKYLHTSRAEWFCKFLLRFPTPQSIKSLSKEAFVEAAWDLIGSKVAKQRLLYEMFSVAKNSIGLPVEEDGLAVQTFRLQVERYLVLTQQRNQLENWAEKALGSQPDYQRLKTLPGIGPILALTILAESGDLRRFPHHRHYLKFCGFDLCSIQSGQTQGRYRISKRGNSRLRYAFWIAATVAIRQRENSFRSKYERYIAKDPDNADLRRKARAAVAAKMARVAHALIKTGIDYRGYHEAAIPGGGTSLSGP